MKQGFDFGSYRKVGPFSPTLEAQKITPFIGWGDFFYLTNTCLYVQWKNPLLFGLNSRYNMGHSA